MPDIDRYYANIYFRETPEPENWVEPTDERQEALDSGEYKECQGCDFLIELETEEYLESGEYEDVFVHRHAACIERYMIREGLLNNEKAVPSDQDDTAEAESNQLRKVS